MLTKRKKMKNIYFILSISGLLFATNAWSQARMVFQNNPYVVIDNGAYLVLDNANTNAITNPAQGNIVSEDEFDFLKWNITNQTGTYVIPFTTASDVKIPLTVNISGAGNGGANPNFLFSTYGGLGGGPWISDLNKPSDVLHTVDIATGLVENSAFVIDRFWIVDCLGYANRPSATLNIGYDEAEHTQAANTIVESLLGGQRYNSDSNVWGDYLPQGTADVAGNVVNGIPAPAADFYRSWTLVSRDMPLPVEMLSFTANCDNGTTRVLWSTATETNNDYFMIERSSDGFNWEFLGEVEGAGNSSVEQHYEFVDYAPNSSTTYYRITQFDFNGTYKEYGPVASSCSDFNLEIVSVFNNISTAELGIAVSSSVDENFDLYVTDLSGKVLFGEQNLPIRTGMNQLNVNRGNLSMGIYIIQLVNTNHLLTRKVILN